jgi:hypothetical protein
LVNWKISLELTGEIEQEEQNLMAMLSQAYLEWEQQTEQRGEQRGIAQGIERGERSLVLRLLTEQVGELPAELRQQVEALPLKPLENLGSALLRFRQLEDLLNWLEQNGQGDLVS